MLRFILGTAGTGKTTRLYEEIAQVVAQGKKAILLVPEQVSFESEKVLYRKLGAQAALHVEVLSFTRLCNSVFRRYGSLAGSYVSTAAKHMIMNLTLNEVRDSLCVYHRHTANTSFVSSMVSLISELKTAGISADAFEQATYAACDGADKKLCDLSLIYTAYNAFLEQSYLDTDDDLLRACKLLEGQDFFSSYTVFIDGFMAFMGGEYRLLSHMIAGCENMYIALCCDSLHDTQQGMGVFSAVQQTAGRMIRMAGEACVGIASPVILSEAKRFRDVDLDKIGKEYFLPVYSTKPACNTGFQLCKCTSLYSEIERICIEIGRLVREKKVRYSEIAVISRSLEAYETILAPLFEKFEIPCYMDRRSDIESHPLIGFLLTALDAVRLHFNTDSILKLAKSPVLGLDLSGVSMLENYCYIWDVRNGMWTQEFRNNPDGMSARFEEKQQEQLDTLNRLRIRLIAPLEKMYEQIRQCNGETFARTLYEYLSEMKAAENLQEYAQSLPVEQQKSFLDDSALLWDAVIGLLDLFEQVLSGTSMPLSRMTELFRLAVQSIDVGQLPQTLDQVIVGMADRVRPVNAKAVFVIGATEGNFPAMVKSSDILGDVERKILREQGVGSLYTSEQKSVFEKFYCYFALTVASEYLSVSYAQADMKGNPLAPSGMVHTLERMFGRKAVAFEPEDIDRILNDRTAFELLAQHYGAGDVLKSTLIAYFENKQPERLVLLSRARSDRNFHLAEKQTAKRLFGERMRLSPSRVERYKSCPFAFFCESGLKIKPRKKAEFSPLESGSLTHLVLQVLVSKYGGKGLCSVEEAVLRAEAAQIVADYLGERVRDMAKMSPRFKYLFNRLVSTLMRLLGRLAEEFAQSEFEPQEFELPIRQDSKVAPLELRLPDGGSVVVEGVVDRVDVMKRGNVHYVRVVDYKSGVKQFRLSDIYFGLNMQMLIYLFSVCQSGLGENAQYLSAGVLYLPAKDSVIASSRDMPNEEVRREQQKKLRMNGLILDNIEVVSGMEREMAGVFIPAKQKKDGSLDAHSSIATLAQFSAIQNHIEKLLTGMATELRAGNIAPRPVEGLGYEPCTYCDYHSVCLREEGAPTRSLFEMDMAEVMKKISGGET